MKPNHGYVFLWRGWMNHPVLAKGAGPFTRREAWAWLIEHAAWHDQGGLRRGQLSVTQRFLASAWKWPRMSVKRFLDELSGTEMLKSEHKNGTGKSLITVCNYEKYQGSWDSSGTGFGTDTPEKRDTILRNKNSPTVSKETFGERAPTRARDPHVLQKSRKREQVNGHHPSAVEKLWEGAHLAVEEVLARDARRAVGDDDPSDAALLDG